MLKTDSSNNPKIELPEESIDSGRKEDEKDKPETDRKITYTTRWVNLYGCNADYSGAEADKQNQHIDEATTFKGRVLVEYWTIDHKHPVMKIRDIKEDQEYKDRISAM